MQDKPRIGTVDKPGRIEIYNSNYGVLGKRIGNYPKPWSALTPRNGEQFHSHAEALAWALKEVEAWK